MPFLYIVRHGEAAATFAQHLDPGLSELGQSQAHRSAELLKNIGPLPILTSPLARARETAQPLADLWDITPQIDDRFAEVPSPPALGLDKRALWLRQVMNGKWMDLPDELLGWRNTMIEAALDFSADHVIFSHFIAINVLVGAALGSTELIVFRPDNASITQLSKADNRLVLVAQGSEAQTKIN